MFSRYLCCIFSLFFAPKMTGGSKKPSPPVRSSNYHVLLIGRSVWGATKASSICPLSRRPFWVVFSPETKFIMRMGCWIPIIWLRSDFFVPSKVDSNLFRDVYRLLRILYFKWSPDVNTRRKNHWDNNAHHSTKLNCRGVTESVLGPNQILLEAMQKTNQTSLHTVGPSTSANASARGSAS